MRRRVPVLACGALLALTLAACEGPTGPTGSAGSQGPAGPAGPAGPTGPAGQDANENCTQCHTNNSELLARQIQYQASAHYVNGNFERNGASCARCHTNEGFLELVETGTVAADVNNPSPPNCRTCHQIHTTYTDTDYALTTTSPVELMFPAGETVDLGPKGNLCGTCHQARDVSPVPVIGGDDVTITASRYGVHYSPVANIMGGTGLFEFSGSAPVTGGAMAHGRTDVGCPTCHMATAYGKQSGGHTLKMAYDYHGSMVDNVAGCLECHSAALEDFSFLGTQATVQAKLDELETLLQAKGILSPGGHYANKGTYSADVTAAFLNWFTVLEDKSMGIHNPRYVINVLTNTIETIK